MSDLFNMGLDSGMDFLSKKEGKKDDGILRLDAKAAKDPKKGLRIVMRFLPNLTSDGKLGANAVEKIVHYVKIPNQENLNGFIDSMKNFPNEKCELTNLFWEFKNSKSVIENDKAQLISRSTKYYSYVQIIEHETEPELVGKIMILPFGIKIKNKINEEKTGDITGTQVNVYDIANGKDFVCIVKEIGGYTNYDSSQFKSIPSAIQIPTKDGVLKEVPTIESNGKKAIDPKFQDKVVEYLTSKTINLQDFAPVRWDEETRSKVSKIIAILKDNPIVSANNSIASAKRANDDTFFEETDETPVGKSGSESSDDFFNF